MEVKHKIELKADKFDKCQLVFDSDCPIGQLYDYACILKHFLAEKVKEADEKEKSVKEPIKE